MKKITILCGLFLLNVSNVLALDPSDPIQFRAQTPAKSANVNAIHNDLVDSIRSKQYRISASCEQGSSISAINADGSVVCEVDDTGSNIQTVDTGIGLIREGTASDIILSVDTGTSAGKIVQLDVNAKLPSVDGANL